MKIKLFLSIFILYIFFSPILIFGQDEIVNKKSYFTKNQISDEDKLKVFNNLWDKVNLLYFDSTFNGVDWSKMREVYQPQVLAAKNKIELKRVLNKLVDELKTSHLAVSFEIGMRGKTINQLFGEKVDYKNNSILFGYGYTATKFDNDIVVTQVNKNSSAEQVGIKTGWIVKSCEIFPTTKVVNDSTAFTESAKCIFATETESNKEINFSQGWFLSPFSKKERSSKLLPDNILYLKFTEFQKGLGKWLKQEINSNYSAKSIIVDLRSNEGGLISEMKDALSLFFPPKTVIGEFIERDSDEKTARVGSENHYTGNVIILIDGSSYSCAEIFAAAFQELERGKIIGQTSGGSVLGSVTKSLSNDFKLQIPIWDYKTVKGNRLEGKGVTPNIIIPFSIQNFRQHNDLVLDETLKLLK